MYKYESVKDFEADFDEKYVKALEEGRFTDEEAAALLIARGEIARLGGEIRGMRDAQEALGLQNDQRFNLEIEEKAKTLEEYCESIVRKMEEFGLM